LGPVNPARARLKRVRYLPPKQTSLNNKRVGNCLTNKEFN